MRWWGTFGRWWGTYREKRQMLRAVAQHNRRLRKAGATMNTGSPPNVQVPLSFPVRLPFLTINIGLPGGCLAMIVMTVAGWAVTIAAWTWAVMIAAGCLGAHWGYLQLLPAVALFVSLLGNLFPTRQGNAQQN